MSESLNASFIKLSEDQIQQKTKEMLEFFEKKGYKPDSPFNEDLWFFQEINQDQSHPLWKVIGQTINYESVFTENIPQDEAIIETFVQKLVDEAKALHQNIVRYKSNMDYVKDDLANYQKFQAKIDQNKTEYAQENAIVISYVDQVTQISEIQKYYKLKYKVGTVHQNYQPLYPELSNRSTCLSIDKTVELITIIIMGKRLDKNLGDEVTLGEDFKEIAQVQIPLGDIYNLIKPRHFALVTIPQCYLKISYQDQSLDAPCNDVVELNLRFDVRLGYEERKDVIKQQLEFKKDTTQKFEELLQKSVAIMNQLLLPFKGDPNLQYVVARGIGQPKDLPQQDIAKHKNEDKDKDQIKQKSRDSCCIIQ